MLSVKGIGKIAISRQLSVRCEDNHKILNRRFSPINADNRLQFFCFREDRGFTAAGTVTLLPKKDLPPFPPPALRSYQVSEGQIEGGGSPPTLVHGLQPEGNSVLLQLLVILLSDLGILFVISEFIRIGVWVITPSRPYGIVISFGIRARWLSNPSPECKLS